jgi:hypothetical protein
VQGVVDHFVVFPQKPLDQFLGRFDIVLVADSYRKLVAKKAIGRP